MSIYDFFLTKIKTLWDVLDGLNPFPTYLFVATITFFCDIAKKSFKMQLNNRVISFFFLMKLDKKYSQVKSNMLMIIVEKRNDSLACKVEKRKFQERGKIQSENNKNKRLQFYCDHCRISGHTKDKCWKLVGYPPNFKRNTWKRDKSNAKATTSQQNTSEEETVTAVFTLTQYQQILEMLNKHGNNKAINTYANSSHLTCMFCLTTLKDYEWIIDSGASDHMCHDLFKFFSYHLLKNQSHTITIPDGRSILVKYIGQIKLSNGIILNNVLYVP